MTSKPDETRVPSPVFLHRPVFVELSLCFVLSYGRPFLDDLLLQPSVPAHHRDTIPQIPIIESLYFSGVLDRFRSVNRGRDHSRFGPERLYHRIRRLGINENSGLDID